MIARPTRLSVGTDGSKENLLEIDCAGLAKKLAASPAQSIYILDKEHCEIKDDQSQDKEQYRASFIEQLSWCSR